MSESERRMLEKLGGKAKPSQITYQIRAMQHSEIAQVHDFFTRNHHLQGFSAMDDLYFETAELEKAPYALVAVDAQGVVIGAALLNQYQDEDEKTSVNTITCIGVEPKHQGKLIGQNLLRATIAVSQRIGCDELGVYASSDHEAIFYKAKAGFEIAPNADEDSELSLPKSGFASAIRKIEGENARKAMDVSIEIDELTERMRASSSIVDDLNEEPPESSPPEINIK